MYSGDLNAIQDQYADLYNLLQNLGIASVAVGESGLQIVRYGAGEARLTGAMRTDGIFRGLGGIYAGQFTTTQRDAIASGSRPLGLQIFNTTNNRMEVNVGSDASPDWQPLDSVAPVTRTIITSGTGTWNVPNLARTILAECTGGGGAGAAVQTGSDSTKVGAAGGGGGGGYGASLISSLPASYSYVVGLGGVDAGSANGGDTTFGSVSGYGGGAGNSSLVNNSTDISPPGGIAGGNGGTGAGDIVVPGEIGGYSWALSYANGGYRSGRGGHGGGPYGGGGGAEVSGNFAGNGGGNYGAGGSGAACLPSSGGNVYYGGDGAPGIIVLTIHY